MKKVLQFSMVSGQLFQSGLSWLELNGHMSGMVGMTRPSAHQVFYPSGGSLRLQEFFQAKTLAIM